MRVSSVVVALLALHGWGESLPNVLAPDPARVAEIAAHLPEVPAWPDEPFASDSSRAERRLAEPISDCSDERYLLTTKTGDRMVYQKAYFDRHVMLKDLTWAARTTGEDRYVRRIVEVLDAVCAERSWTLPAHDLKLTNFNGTLLTIDLGSAHQAYVLAGVLAQLGDRLPADVRARTMAQLERWIFGPFRATNTDSGDLEAFRRHGNWWFFVRNNWSAVCHSCIIRAALAVLPDRHDRAAFVEAAERGMRYFLESFGEDGYCTEGLGYWNYGYASFIEMAVAVRTATDGFVDFSKLPRAKDSMSYVFGYKLDDGHCPVFADGGGGVANRKTIERACEFWPELKSVRDGALPPRTYFPSAQVYIGRASRVSFAVKGGHNGELHNHNDLGSWTLVADGREIAGDPGAEIYTARTFSKDRYVSDVLNSYGHPVPRVNGELQLTGREVRAEVVRQDYSDARDVVLLDLSEAYPSTRGQKGAVRRAVVFDRAANRVRISDRLKVSSPMAFESPVVTFEKTCPLVPSAQGGAWHLEEKTIENPGRPSPHRHAVVFDEPVSEATVTWTFDLASEKTNGAARTLAEQVPAIRTDHPRLFFNADTWLAVKAAAEGPAKTYRDALLARCDGYPDAPVCTGTEPAPEGHSNATPLRDVREWGQEASECALAWRFTGERKYLEKAKRMLAVSIAAYHEAYRNRRAVNWYGRKRILALCAYDWLYEALTDDERRAIIVPLVQHVDDVQPGPGKPAIVRRNGGPFGYRTGHYGVDGILWYSGLAAFGDGYCDDFARKHLETGYGYLRQLFAYRQAGAGDDGPLSTSTCGYAMGEYPWAHFNYLHTLKSAAGIDAAPLYPGLALFPNYIWWNWIRSDLMPLQFGSGDTRHCQNHLLTDRLNEHLTQYAYFYAKSDPDVARLSTTMLKDVPKNRLDANWPVYPYLFSSVKPIEPFTEEELRRRSPRARHFETAGQVVMRSGWKPDSTYAMLTAGGMFKEHRHFDENSFIIYKKGFLALDSGTRAYQDDYNLAYYYAQTVAHNCVLIHRTDEPMPNHWGLRYDGPEGRFCDGGQTVYSAAKIVAFETNPLFTYVAADATAAYPGKCRECVRQFVHVTDDCFVIYDRVTSERADDAKEWLLHSENEPEVADGLLKTTANGGTLFCRTLLPGGAVQEKIGGPGREFWSNGKNWEVNPRYLADSERKCAAKPGSGPWFGKWRLSVRPSQAAESDRFLHVINVSGERDAQPCPCQLERETSRDVAVFDVAGVTVKGRTGTLKVSAAFNRTGAVGGEISYCLLDESGTPIFSGHRPFTTSVQSQSGVFGQVGVGTD